MARTRTPAAEGLRALERTRRIRLTWRAWTSLLLGLLAVILGIAAIVRRRGRGKGIAGLVLGSIAVVLSIPTVPNLFYSF